MLRVTRSSSITAKLLLNPRYNDFFPVDAITTFKTRFNSMEEWIRKEDVLELIKEHWDLFDGYTDQQTFKDLIEGLPTVTQEQKE